MEQIDQINPDVQFTYKLTDDELSLLNIDNKLGEIFTDLESRYKSHCVQPIGECGLNLEILSETGGAILNGLCEKCVYPDNVFAATRDLKNLASARYAAVSAITLENLAVQENDTEAVDEVLVEELELGVRAYNCLKKSGIHTLDDLTSKTYSEIESLPNLGINQLGEIIAVLRHWQLDFKPEDNDNQLDTTNNETQALTPESTSISMNLDEIKNALADIAKDLHDGQTKNHDYKFNADPSVAVRIYSAINQLDYREQRIIKLRFGLEDGLPKSLKETSTYFPVSPERIRQIQYMALKKIQELLR